MGQDHHDCNHAIQSCFVQGCRLEQLAADVLHLASLVSDGVKVFGVLIASTQGGLMRDLKEFCSLLISFLPWLLFLFLSGHSLSSLKVAIIVSLLTTLILAIHDLRRGIILAWATLIFFLLCAVFVNLLDVVWVAKSMELLAKSFLASVMWFTLAVGQPFVLQYARRDLPKDQWNQPKLIQGCRFLTLVWAWLMSLAVVLAILRRSVFIGVPDWVYFDASLVIIFTGLLITTLFKRRKRIQREKAGLQR